MKVFLYEYITAGGTFSSQVGLRAEGSLLAEGEGMLRALVQDYLKMPGCEVQILLHQGLCLEVPEGVSVRNVGSAAEERKAFDAACQQADAVLIVAPEIDGALLERTRWAELALQNRPEARLLSPAGDFLRIACDKQATCEHLTQHQIPVPQGWRVEDASELIAWQKEREKEPVLPQGYLLKALEGAGSWGQARLHAGEKILPEGLVFPLRAEHFCEGLPFSVAILSGKKMDGTSSALFCPPLKQVLSAEDRTYLGAEALLDANLVQRAYRLAVQVHEAMPPTNGYWGLDGILGVAPDGSQDVVVEVNPRITTSYIGLRQGCGGNLAEAICQIAAGKKPALSWSLAGLEFRLAAPSWSGQTDPEGEAG